jgi:hypothetical protein
MKVGEVSRVQKEKQSGNDSRTYIDGFVNEKEQENNSTRSDNDRW